MRFKGAGHMAILALRILPFASHVCALNLDVNDQQSIKDAGSTATYNMMTWYKENGTDNPGFISRSWWTGAALFLACLNYWHATNDTTYNEEVSIGMQHQGSSTADYMPTWATGIGNDDQMFWGLAAITAAEYNFPNRPTGNTWLTLAEGVFNDQKDPDGKGWDTTVCGGGIRWQKELWQGGYTMKNAVSNGGFFMLAARLAWFKQEDGYSTWAQKVWDWSTSVNLVNDTTWEVADSVRQGTGGPDGCSLPDNTRWTYNYGTFASGAAYMYAYTNDAKWLNITTSLVDAIFTTFALPKHGGVITDWNCEASGRCYLDANGPLFKGLTVSWLADIALIIPELKDKILPKLQISAEGAAKSCTGNNENLCGNRWYGGYDGQNSMENAISGSQMMSAVMLKFLGTSSKPVSTATGGNGTSDPNAGRKPSGPAALAPITTADKAGAGILTAVFVCVTIGGLVFLFMGP